MKKSKIERNLLEKSAAEFIEQQKRNNEVHLLSNRSARQSHFEKSYKKK